MRVDYIIVGGGFTGLYLAGSLKELGYSALVITENVGGMIRSFVKNGFTFDLGGHVYTNDDDKLNLVLKARAHTVHTDRQAFYSDHGVAVPFPVQQAWKDKIKPPAQTLLPINFESYLLNQFGKGLYTDFFKPFNTRVWGTEPSLMDSDWVKERVQTKDGMGEKKWGMNASFVYAKGSDIIDTLVKRADGQEIIEGTVLFIGGNKNVFMRKDGHHFEVKAELGVIDTTGMFFSSERRSHVVSIGVGFDRRLHIRPFHWLYGPVTRPVHRLTLLGRYTSYMLPTRNENDSMLLEAMYSDDAPLHPSIHELVWRVRRGEVDKAAEIAVRLVAMTVPTEESWFVDGKNLRLNEWIETIWVGTCEGYPVPTIGVRKRVADKKHELALRSIYSCGRWGSHGYFNLQHLIKDVDATIDYMLHGENENGYFNADFYYARS